MLPPQGPSYCLSSLSAAVTPDSATASRDLQGQRDTSSRAFLCYRAQTCTLYPRGRQQTVWGTGQLRSRRSLLSLPSPDEPVLSRLSLLPLTR